MAKVNAPLFSFSASGKIANALVYFGWKGLDVVRSYVVPTNPDTDAQKVQRAYVRAAVAKIHEFQAHDTFPLVALDIVAYSLWASIYPTPMTWFNRIVKMWIDQYRASPVKEYVIWTQGKTTPASKSLIVEVNAVENTPDSAEFYWGTTPTALIHKAAGVKAGGVYSYTIPTLAALTKYFWQCRPLTPVEGIGAYSGIYHGKTLA